MVKGEGISRHIAKVEVAVVIGSSLLGVAMAEQPAAAMLPATVTRQIGMLLVDRCQAGGFKDGPNDCLPELALPKSKPRATPRTETGQAGSPPPADFIRLATCESTSSWHINTGNGYYGGIQILEQTWKAEGGLGFAPRADLATETQQIIVGQRIEHAQGWRAWPVCSRVVGLA